MMNVAALLRTAPRVRSHALAVSARGLATRPPPSGSSDTAGASGSKEVDSSAPGPSDPSKQPQNALSLDFSPDADTQDDGSQRTGARSSKDSLSSIERKRRAMGRATLGLMGLGVIAGAFYLGREWEPSELASKKMTVENAPSTRTARTKERFTSMFDFFSKPTWEELLPPPTPPFSKPYTLLLSIDDLLVTSTWDRQHGWRTAKRPGVDYFLAYLSQFYEIVVFTSQNHYTAIPVIEKLDPYSFFITYKLFRESTRSVNGSVVKDLSYLNRDLSKVIILDTDPEHVALQPENAVVMPKWKGDSSDRDLVAMIPFLESIAIYKPQDVRPILKTYAGKNIPIEYGKKEADAKQKFLEDWRKSGKGGSSGGLTLSGLFGASSSESSGPEPLTYLEQKRKEAQAHYREEQAYIAENKSHFDKLIEDDRKAMEQQMSGNFFSILSNIGGPPPGPPQQQQPQQSGQVQEKKS